LQTLLTEGQQQFGFVHSQRLCALAVGVGEFGDIVFQQRGTLVHAQQFVAQHAVGGIGLLQALTVAAHVSAQAVEARFQRFQPLRRFDVGGPFAFRLLLAAVPDTTTACGEQKQQQQPSPAAATWCARGRRRMRRGDGGRCGAFGHWVWPAASAAALPAC
jgi:hypothetical protein